MIGRGSVGDQMAIGWRLFLKGMSSQYARLFGDRSTITRRFVGDQSATKNCVGFFSAATATGSKTCRQSRDAYDLIDPNRMVLLAAIITPMRQKSSRSLPPPATHQS